MADPHRPKSPNPYQNKVPDNHQHKSVPTTGLYSIQNHTSAIKEMNQNLGNILVKQSCLYPHNWVGREQKLGKCTKMVKSKTHLLNGMFDEWCVIQRNSGTWRNKKHHKTHHTSIWEHLDLKRDNKNNFSLLSPFWVWYGSSEPCGILQLG